MDWEMKLWSFTSLVWKFFKLYPRHIQAIKIIIIEQERDIDQIWDTMMRLVRVKFKPFADVAIMRPVFQGPILPGPFVAA